MFINYPVEFENWPKPRYTAHEICRLDVITSNLIALALCGVVAILLQTDWLLPHSAALHHTFIVILELLAAIQILKSSSKSLILPSICLTVGCIGLIAHHAAHLHLPLSVSSLHAFTAIGTIGICIGILKIP